MVLHFLKPEGQLLVIIGPSGSGKSTVVQKLVSNGVVEVTPSWTTRPPRSGELDVSVEHEFVTEQHFNQKEKEGFFLETVKLFGLPYSYGLPRIKKPGKCVPAVMLRAPLLSLLTKHYKNPVVYQVEDEYERIRKRLDVRTSEGEKQGTRLIDYQKELLAGRKLADRIFKNERDIDSLIKDIKVAINKDFKQ